MVKHAKPLKRTQQKGLRPLPPRTPDVFPEKKAKRGEEEIERILDGNSLNSKQEFLCKYLLVVCRFRLAQENKEYSSNIYREIKHLEGETYNFGLKPEDLIVFNRVLRDKNKSDIGRILEKLKEKEETIK